MDTKGEKILTGHVHYIRKVAFSSDGSQLASASFDKEVWVWDFGTGQVLHVLTGHTYAASKLTFTPDGQQLSSTSIFEQILWDLNTGTKLQTSPQNLEEFFMQPSPADYSRSYLSLDYPSAGWVTYCGMRVLHLPPDRKAAETAFHDNRAVIGHRTGQITILEFDLDALEDCISRACWLCGSARPPGALGSGKG